jgi:hypothetical protein
VSYLSSQILFQHFLIGYVLPRIRGLRAEYNGFWIGCLDLLALLLHLPSIITAHNQCLRLASFRTGLQVSSLLRD